MLYRKIGKYIEDWLTGGSDKTLIIEGARQTGKSFIIREVGTRLSPCFVEINFVEDDEGPGIFRGVHTTSDFYFALSMVAGKQLSQNASSVLVFLDEIQHYPQFLTLLKFLRQEGRYRYIASGSMLGLALRDTTSIPIGSVIRKQMHQLDFEEFIIANGVATEAADHIKERLSRRETLPENLHNHLMSLFRKYLIVGGMPDAVNAYLAMQNIVEVREIQQSIQSMYGDDAAKYENAASRKLLIRRIYEMIPSQMENKKKRIVATDIQGRRGDRFAGYIEEFEYLISSGIAIDAKAISNPRYPLVQSAQKNLLKLYMNDVGMLSMLLYGNNVMPVIDDKAGINLGALYETVVAQELKAHGKRLFYYDNRHKGEVDFIVDDNSRLSVLPIEVKSGKDYTVHSALNNLLATEEYGIKEGLVLSNNREVTARGSIVYLPIYHVMLIGEQ